MSIGIARLLEDYRAQTGDSYSTLAAKTGLNRSSFGYLINTTPPFRVAPRTVQALSEGLNIPLHVVIEAMLVTAGLDEDASPLPARSQRAAARMALLPPDKMRLVEDLLSALGV